MQDISYLECFCIETELNIYFSKAVSQHDTRSLWGIVSQAYLWGSVSKTGYHKDICPDKNIHME